MGCSAVIENFLRWSRDAKEEHPGSGGAANERAETTTRDASSRPSAHQDQQPPGAADTPNKNEYALAPKICPSTPRAGGRTRKTRLQRHDARRNIRSSPDEDSGPRACT